MCGASTHVRFTPNSDTKTNLIERDFPHKVETLVPEAGLGKHLDEMHDR